MTAALLLAGALLVATGPMTSLRRIGDRIASTQRISKSRCDTDLLGAASTFDVLAVCVTAGMAVPTAAAAAAGTAPPGVGEVLRRAADLLALGADPDLAWSVPARSGRDGDDSQAACAALVRLARRSATSGAALAHGAADLAEQSRQDAAQAATAAGERAAVLIAGPLGLCFLPAFVCLGLVPAIVGLAGDLFSVGTL